MTGIVRKQRQCSSKSVLTMKEIKPTLPYKEPTNAFSNTAGKYLSRGAVMNMRYLVIGLAALVLSAPLAAERTDAGVKSDGNSSASLSQKKLMKLEVSLARKGAANRDFRATKVVLSIANGKFVGTAYLLNLVLGKSQICPIANFSATPDIDAEISKNSSDSKKVLLALEQKNFGKVVYRLRGDLKHGLLETEAFDDKKHLVSLSSRDVKSGVLIRSAVYDSEERITGYTRYFGIDNHSVTPFKCDGKAKIFRNYEFRKGKVDVKDLDATLIRLVGIKDFEENVSDKKDEGE